MHISKTKLILMAALVVGITFCHACTTSVTPVYLLRHAEKGPGDDPDLTSDGDTRAQELRRVLHNVPVAAVYSTNTKRTQQTVQHLADDHGLVILHYSGTSIANTVLSEHSGQNTVIVGHSDTVPQLITAFGGTPPYDLIPSSQYDNLFLLIVKKSSKLGGGSQVKANVQHLKYGAVSNELPP